MVPLPALTDSFLRARFLPQEEAERVVDSKGKKAERVALEIFQENRAYFIHATPSTEKNFRLVSGCLGPKAIIAPVEVPAVTESGPQRFQIQYYRFNYRSFVKRIGRIFFDPEQCKTVEDFNRALRQTALHSQFPHLTKGEVESIEQYNKSSDLPGSYLPSSYIQAVRVERTEVLVCIRTKDKTSHVWRNYTTGKQVNGEMSRIVALSPVQEEVDYGAGSVAPLPLPEERLRALRGTFYPPEKLSPENRSVIRGFKERMQGLWDIYRISAKFPTEFTKETLIAQCLRVAAQNLSGETLGKYRLDVEKIQNMKDFTSCFKISGSPKWGGVVAARRLPGGVPERFGFRLGNEIVLSVNAEEEGQIWLLFNVRDLERNLGVS